MAFVLAAGHLVGQLSRSARPIPGTGCEHDWPRARRLTPQTKDVLFWNYSLNRYAAYSSGIAQRECWVHLSLNTPKTNILPKSSYTTCIWWRLVFDLNGVVRRNGFSEASGTRSSCACTVVVRCVFVVLATARDGNGCVLTPRPDHAPYRCQTRCQAASLNPNWPTSSK
jgi:hypothetical protein